MKTCGEVLVEILEAYGIDTVFGIPGVHTVELYRGLPNTKLRHITPRHEQGAGFMADGYARACGRPAACFIISGPGMTNITTAMGQAYAEFRPDAGDLQRQQQPRAGPGRGAAARAAGPVRAGRGRLGVQPHGCCAPAELPEVIARAFAVFDGARPRPVHIELPLDVITAPADDLSRRRSPPAAAGRAPTPQAIARAADAAARRQAAVRRARRRLRRTPRMRPAPLVERLGALTAVTINAQGRAAAGASAVASAARLPQTPVLDALRSADVVLAIGTELGETDTLLFYGQLELGGKVIRIDIDPEQLVRNALPEVAICSRCRSGDAAL